MIRRLFKMILEHSCLRFTWCLNEVLRKLILPGYSLNVYEVSRVLVLDRQLFLMEFDELDQHGLNCFSWHDFKDQLSKGLRPYCLGVYGPF